MTFKEIQENISTLCSNSSSFAVKPYKINFYINNAVDYINSYLRTNFMTPSEQYYNNKNYYDLIYNEHYKGEFINADSLEKINGDIYYNLPDSLYYSYDEDTTTWKVYDILNALDPSKTFSDYYDVFDYTVFPDRHMRQCVIYKATALFLEEEDELEQQYYTFSNKADAFLKSWQQIDYSCYDTPSFSGSKEYAKNNVTGVVNPYADGGTDVI